MRDCLIFFFQCSGKIPIAISSEGKSKQISNGKKRDWIYIQRERKSLYSEIGYEKNRRKQLNHFLIRDNWNRNWLIASVTLPISSYRWRLKKGKYNLGWLGWNKDENIDWAIWSILGMKKWNNDKKNNYTGAEKLTFNSRWCWEEKKGSTGK